ncbi:unnamed protein product, partial [marine sediment metagenome]
DNTIKNTEDVERILNLPILGVIPKDPPEKKKKLKRKHQQPKSKNSLSKTEELI